MKDNTQEMLRRARELMGSGQVFQPMGMDAAKAKLEQHLNGGISNARDRLRESAQCEQTVLALNDLLNETQKKAMILVADNDRLRAELAELRKQPAAVPEAVAKDVSALDDAGQSNRKVAYAWFPLRLSRKRQLISDCGITMPQALTESDSQWAMRALLAMLERAECRAAILSAADTEVKNG